MCLFSFPFNTSTTRRKDSSSSSYSFKPNKDKPQGPITRKKGLRQPPRPPPPPPPTPEPTPKGRNLSPRRGKRGNVLVPLGETNCARRRHSGSPARSSGGARSSSRARCSSRGDKHGGSNRTSKEGKEKKRGPAMEPWNGDEMEPAMEPWRGDKMESWKGDEGELEEHMWRMHLQNHYNKSDQAKAQTQTQPHTWPPSRLPGSDVLYPSSASGAYHKGAGIQVQDFQRESQPRNSGDGFHTEGFIHPEGNGWTWLKGGEGSYILVVITQLEMGGFDLL